jgi:hypothetical protein
MAVFVGFSWVSVGFPIRGRTLPGMVGFVRQNGKSRDSYFKELRTP